jgi:hypothetical protein
MIYDRSGNLGEFREIAQVFNALKQQNRCEEVLITTDKCSSKVDLVGCWGK